MPNASTTEHTTPTGLRPNSLGVAGIVFFVVAAASPLSAVLGSSPAAIGVGTGAGAPSSYLLAGALLLVFSVGYSAMSRHVAAGGGFASYVRAAFGARSGRAAGYVASVAYLAMQAGLYGVFGFFAEAIFAGFGVSASWFAWAGGAWVVVAILGYLDIDLSAKLLGVLMILEVLVLLVVSIAILAQGGASGIEFSSFTPAVATAGAFGIAIMFAFASFIGFEATAIYSEEAKDRKRTIPRATYAAVLLITVFLVFTVWSFVLGYGAADVQRIALDDPDAFVFTLAARYVAPVWASIMQVLLVTSFFAALLAFQNTVARYLRSLATEHWAPAPLARTHPRFRSPHVASVTTSLVTGAILLVFGLTGQDPYATLFLWFVGVGTLAVVVLQAWTSLAVVVFFRRTQEELSLVKTLVAPAIGAVGLAAAVVVIVANWPLLVGSSDGAAPFLPLIIPLAALVGFILPLRTR